MALSLSFATCVVLACVVAETLASDRDLDGAIDDDLNDIRSQTRHGQRLDVGLSNGTCVCLSERLGISEQASFRSAAILSAKPSDCARFNGDFILKDGDIWCQVRMRKGTKTGWVPCKYLEVAPEYTCSVGSDIIGSDVMSDETSPEFGFARGVVSQRCLKCICEMASGCKPVGCKRVTPWSMMKCGYFMISETYWVDCGKPGTDWKTCANDLRCSSWCVQKYMGRWAVCYKCPLVCQGFVREHVGGRAGCRNPRTLAFWEQLQTLPGCRGVRH